MLSTSALAAETRETVGAFEVTGGTSGTDYSYSNGAATRAQVVTILYRLEGEFVLFGENLGYPYEDVPADTWYTDAVYRARLNGIVYGNSDAQFDPEDPITREQMAAMLYRYAQFKGYDVTAIGDLSGFADADTVSGWAQEAMSWSVGAGLIQGDENGLPPPPPPSAPKSRLSSCGSARMWPSI